MNEKITLLPLPEDTAELFKSGYSLVHMLEAYTNDIYHPNRQDLKMENYIHYVDNEGGFKNLPCSSIKEGFGMGLYNMENLVGLMFDARQADLLYTAPNLTGNCVIDENGTVAVTHISIFPETDDIQMHPESGFRDGGRVPDGLHAGKKCMIIPQDTSPKKNELCLRAIDEGWRQIENIGIEEYCSRTWELDHDLEAVTETLVNIKSIKDAKGIIYQCVGTMPGYDEIKNNHYAKPLHALAFKGSIKKQFGVDLPILAYRNSGAGSELHVMEFDKAKVEEVINNSPNMTNILRENILHAFEPLVVAGAANSKITDGMAAAPAIVPKSPVNSY